MRKSKFSESQIVGILKDAESGVPCGVLVGVDLACSADGRTPEQHEIALVLAARQHQPPV
jgi:hypothetical protein